MEKTKYLNDHNKNIHHSVSNKELSFKRHEILCELLNYQFKEINLLEQALTRKSGLLEGKQDKSVGHNERLEFLGDSILRTVVDDYLMELYPDAGEDELSARRDALVSKNGFLFQVAEKLMLEEYIIMGNGECNQCKGAGKRKILTDVMEALIGAIFIDSGRNYLSVKSFIGKHSTLQVELQNSYDKQLFIAMKEYNIDKVNIWLAKGANPTVIHNFSYPISCPCCQVDKDFMYREVGLSIHKSTALDLIVRGRDKDKKMSDNAIEIAESLLTYGADPNNKNHFKYGLLHECIIYYPKPWKYETYNRKIYNQLIKLLCEYGADPNSRDSAICCIDREEPKQGQTPLELAIMLRHADQVSILLSCNADPNLKDQRGKTPLHLAIIWYENSSDMKYKNIIRTLLDYGSNPLIKDEENKLPIDYTKDPSIKILLDNQDNANKSNHSFFSKNKKLERPEEVSIHAKLNFSK